MNSAIDLKLKSHVACRLCKLLARTSRGDVVGGRVGRAWSGGVLLPRGVVPAEVRDGEAGIVDLNITF